jgi:hypothetical protein
MPTQKKALDDIPKTSPKIKRKPSSFNERRKNKKGGLHHLMKAPACARLYRVILLIIVM